VGQEMPSAEGLEAREAGDTNRKEEAEESDRATGSA